MNLRAPFITLLASGMLIGLGQLRASPPELEAEQPAQTHPRSPAPDGPITTSDRPAWEQIQAVVERGSPVDWTEAFSELRASRIELDRLWTMAEKDDNRTAAGLLGVLGDDLDIQRLIAQLRTDPLHAYEHMYHVAIGLALLRDIKRKDDCFQVLVDFSDPAHVRGALGRSASSVKYDPVYNITVSASHQLALMMSEEARSRLLNIAKSDHSAAMSSVGAGHRLQAEALMALYRMERMIALKREYTSYEAFSIEINSQQHVSADLARATQELGLAFSDLMKE